MDRWALPLAVGVLAGATTALVTQLVAPPPAAHEPAASPEVEARLARMEASLATLAQRGPALEGRAPQAGAGTGGADAGLQAAAPPRPAALDDAFRTALRAELGKALAEHAATLREAGEQAAKAGQGREPGKRRVELAEAAREMQLSAAEEDSLRRIYADSQDKMMRLLAKDDTELDTMRREMDEATRDPKRRPGMMVKYMPRLLPKLGEVITLQMEQQAAIEGTLGADRAARLERDYDLVEANPLGGGMETRADVRVDRR
jgi:hypothetical protein